MNQQEILNHREKVYWAITDTILQVKGLNQQKQHKILCENLAKICNASVSFLLSYNTRKHILTLLSSYSIIKKYTDINTLPCFEIETDNKFLEQFRYRNIQHSNQFNILNLLAKKINKKIDFDITMLEQEFKGYSVSTFREQEFMIVGHVYLPVNERLRMMDLIGSYINMAGMVIQESSSFQEILDKNKELKIAHGKVEKQKTELIKQAQELEQVNNQLEELNSTKDKFFSIIAHDLKNPFNTIMGFSQVILESYKNLPAERFEKYLQNIYELSKNTFALLQNLLQWARSQTNSINYEPSTIDLNKLVDENIHIIKDMAVKKSISVYNNVAEEMLITGDKNMLNTVLRNLLTNAIKFTPENGTVSVSSELKHNNIIVEVKDTGTGMSEEEQQTLFRIDKSYSKKGTSGETGTGLGLVLCKEFIEKHQGKIWVNSIPAKGTGFYFSLPLQ